MTQTSWLKKIWNGRSKGVSTVIGTVFLMLIIFMVSTNVLLWTFSQNAQYNEAVMEKNQGEADRLNENVIASNGTYFVDEDTDEVTVGGALTNAGPVAAQIMNLWVFDTSIQEYNYTSLNLNLSPGNVVNLTGENAISVTVDGADSAHDFISWFVTARGNTVPLETLEPEQTIITSQVTQGIGSVSMNFTAFKHYNVSEVNGSYILDNYPNGVEGYVVPADSYIAFEVCLTNYDQPDKREIKLFSGSILWALFPVMGAQPRCAGWYIANVYDNGTIAPQYTTITLAYGVPTKVFFASRNDVNVGGFNPSKASYWWQQNKGPTAVNLLLVGEIGGFTYGQNVPFVSIYFES